MLDIFEPISNSENTLLSLDENLPSSNSSLNFSGSEELLSANISDLDSDQLLISDHSDLTTDLNLDLETTATEPQANQDGSDSLTGTSNSETLVGNLDDLDTSEFDSGVFTVGADGEITFDFLFDGGKYKGELGIFSLEDMDEFEPGSEAFIREAARRALTGSDLGHVVISDLKEGSRFSGILGEHEKENWNRGEHQDVKTFAMNSGDEFGILFVPKGKVQQVFEDPSLDGSKRPLFSMTTANPDDIFKEGLIADLTGDGHTFVMEDPWGPDHDYNDFIFQMQGAIGNAVAIDEVIDPEKDWRNSELAQELIPFIVDPLDLAGNTPDDARQSLPSTNGKTYRGWVGSADTDDYYSFSLGMTNEFNLSLDGLWTDANVEVLDFDGNVVLSSASSGTTAESISGTLDHGAYRIRVTNVGDVGTPYNLNLSVTPTIEGITTTGSDAPVFISTNVSNTLINLDDFRSGSSLQGSRSEFAGIDGSGFSTVILDTGIDLDHPFFGPDSNNDGVADRIVHDHDFIDNDSEAEDVNGHGSHVSSILASEDATFTGMAPGANIIHFKVLGDNGSGGFGAIEQALQWVIANAETYNIASVNMSLSYRGNYNTPQARYGIDDELGALAAKGVIVVSASGNSFNAYGTQGVAYPAADPNSLAVGSVGDGSGGTIADQISGFSQRDANLTDIFAPGAVITAADVGGGTTDKSGTSMATPHVAGMAVLAQQLAQQELGRQLSPSEFRQLLYDTGDPINDPVTGVTTFRRANMLGLADGIMDLRPPSDRDIDLSSSRFSVAQSALSTGTNFNVNFQIQNTEADDADSFNVNFYLSDNDFITQRDTLLGTFNINRLAGNSNTGLLTRTLSLPSPRDPVWRSFGNSSGYIGMIVDAKNTIGETDENNNRNTGFLNDYDFVSLNQQGTLAVTINRVKGDFDPGRRIQTDRRGDSDFYARVSFDPNPYTTGNWLQTGKVEGNDIEPDWFLTTSASGRTMPITIQLFDKDRGILNDDDHIDIDPKENAKDLNLIYNLFTGEITGDVTGLGGRQLYSTGGKGEIWFTIDYI
ncbi:MAG: S8 family serine peptidase [Moorea sp. SIO4A3]|nr:S8 family serine peptidase [Moorena sp. SIO4A3]